MKEALRLQPFKYDDSAISWELAPVAHEMTSLGELLRRFYGQFDRSEGVGTYKPLAWARNPVQPNGEPYYIADTILVLFRRNFHVTIERDGLYGPHAAFLYYRSTQAEGETAWVATLQIEAMFYDDQLVKDELICGIHLRQFYHSEKSASIIVIK